MFGLVARSDAWKAVAGCGAGTVYLPVALRLPGLRVRPVFGLVAGVMPWRLWALAPFLPVALRLAGLRVSAVFGVGCRVMPWRLWHWHRFFPVALRFRGWGKAGVWVGCRSDALEGCGAGTVYSPVALRLAGLRVRAVFRLSCRSNALEAVAGCGTGTVCSPVALRLPGLRVSAVFGLVARNDVCEYL
ncbi:hypothetical protein [Raoultella ornithinolytica]|uniref:hypothetical protein n=1 Tax=Raoultella ornithinolytica TaxID=54291 RepID=UPI003D96C39E